MNPTLARIKTEVYDEMAFVLEAVEVESEGAEYDACTLLLDGRRVLSRTAKITPKKVGQFVTCWRRHTETGVTEPFGPSDALAGYSIQVLSEGRWGQFVFPSSVLMQHGIMTTAARDGKRGFRVYPAWDVPLSTQAKKTQKWQLDYFVEFTEALDVETVRRLYAF